MTYTALFLYSLLDNDHFEGYEGFLTGILFAFYCIKTFETISPSDKEIMDDFIFNTHITPNKQNQED